MININKITIAFVIFSMATISQTMDYVQAPEQETHITQKNNNQSKTSSKNPPESVKADYSHAKATKETSAQDISKSISKNQVSYNTPKDSTIKAGGNEIDLSSEKKLDGTTSNYAGLDFTITEEKSIATPEKNTPAIEHLGIADEIIQEQFDARVEELMKEVLHAPDSPHSLEDMLAEALKDLLFHLLDLPTDAQKQKPIESLKKELQFLSEQIQKYSNISVYTDIDDMLEFIEYMNNFIKESHLVPLSTTNIENIDAAYTTASTTSNVFKNQNVILDVKLVPNEVTEMFTQPINDSQNLIKIKDTKSMIHTIYDNDGLIDQIFKSWQLFMASKYTDKKNDLCYAAFMTFLLVFQDSMIATISILNETSKEFQATNQLQMQSISYPTSDSAYFMPQLQTPTKIKNYGSATTNANAKSYDTNVNNSLSMAVSSD